jgi:hypothetical protein
LDLGAVAIAIWIIVVVFVIREARMHEARDRERDTLCFLVDVIQADDGDTIGIGRCGPRSTAAPIAVNRCVGNRVAVVVNGCVCSVDEAGEYKLGFCGSDDERRSRECGPSNRPIGK